MMAAMFTHVLISRFNMTACGAVNKVGLALSYNEKTVCKWQQDFYSNQGNFTESKQGNMLVSLLYVGDGGLHQKPAVGLGKPNMTGTKFCSWVNSDVLPNAQLPPECEQQIQLNTVIKWLHHLEFCPQSHKKSIYIDGHEYDDVVKVPKIVPSKTGHSVFYALATSNM